MRRQRRRASPPTLFAPAPCEGAQTRLLAACRPATLRCEERETEQRRGSISAPGQLNCQNMWALVVPVSFTAPNMWSRAFAGSFNSGERRGLGLFGQFNCPGRQECGESEAVELVTDPR